MYIDYVMRSRSSSCRLLRPINCQTYITLHYISRTACAIERQTDEACLADSCNRPEIFGANLHPLTPVFYAYAGVCKTVL